MTSAPLPKPDLCAFLFMEPFHFNFSIFLLLVALSLFFEFFWVNCNALGQCLQENNSTLLRLKRGFTSGKLESWRPGTDCCMWEGVACDESRRVVGLDLSDRSISGEIDPSLFNLTSLRTLNFADNWFDFMSIPDSGWERLENLSSLNLSNAGFAGKVPVGISHLTKLTSLDLSSYHDEFKVLSFTGRPTFLQNMSSLRELYLDSVNLSAYGDEWCVALVNDTPVLEGLSISGCSLFGVFPKQIFQLRNLKYLDISSNPALSGSLPDFLEDNNLETLVLSNTNFSGNLPDTIGNLKFLIDLYLSSCQFSGIIPPSIGNLSQLLNLDLSNNNKLYGQVPSSLFHISRLMSLSLASNNFSGVVELEFIKDLKNLSWLDLSNTGISLSLWDADDESSASSFPNLFFLGLAGCNLTKIPSFIKYQHQIFNLDLSNNRITGEIPSWLWSIRELPHLLDEEWFLSLANNNLVGQISPSICNLTGVRLLDLSMNKLTGSIPPCLFEGIILHMLNLNGNQLRGAIPNGISPKCELQAIILRDNQLEGLLPRSLSNCHSLEILDLGNNNLKDTFPYWLGNMSSLRILVLRSNNFHGLVRSLDGDNKMNNTFSMLHVFDISSNKFSGKLSEECFCNFKSMMVNREDEIHSFVYNMMGNHHNLDVLTVMNKGRLMTLPKIWKTFKSIDFSNNHFEGEIPVAIGQLISLQVLNMSHNNLIGRIPPQLGNLLDLESMDLSVNKLSGKIPKELVSLHFLSYLNLSYNNLVGKIPLLGQFSTFPNTSFKGNEGLCWFLCNTSVPEVNNTTIVLPGLDCTSLKNKSYMIILGILFGVGLGGSMATVMALDVIFYDGGWTRRNKIPTHG